jgi:iron complex transport system substrate-binding protein
MKRLAWLLVVSACGGAALSGRPAAAADFIDDAGQRITLEAPARRVVTLAPSLTELVYAVGGGDSLVGTVAFSDFPAAAQAVPRVGDFQRLDTERLLGLKPDLVLVWQHGNAHREIAQLRALGLRIFQLEPKRLDDVARALERVGSLLGRAPQGRARADALRAELAALRVRHAGAAPVRVFYQVWSDPLMTLNGEHLVNDVITLCGGRNAFAGLSTLVPQLSTEAVVAADPELMLAARETTDALPDLHRDPRAAPWLRWTRHTGMTAVQRGWFYTVAGDLVARQGPRIAQGAQAVCTALDEVRKERAARR